MLCPPSEPSEQDLVKRSDHQAAWFTAVSWPSDLKNKQQRWLYTPSAGRSGSIYNGAGCGGLCASPQEDTATLCSTANTEDVVTGCALIPLR